MSSPDLHTAGDLAELFLATAARYPDRPAVDAGDTVLDYAAVRARARAVAALLHRRGVVPGDRVGIALAPGPDVVTTILGVLLAGAAYVPLGVGYPAAHLRHTMHDAGLVAVVSDGPWMSDEIPEGTAPIDLAEVLDGDRAPDVPGPRDAAYVIYTSGSTGRPKGVVVGHDNVLSLLRATDGLFAFGPDDRWTLFHSHAFDFSVWEIWGALAYGGCVVTVPPDVAAEPARMLRLLAERRVTVLNQVPSVFGHLVSAHRDDPAELALRYVVFGGEAVRLPAVAAFLDAYRGTPPSMVNMYGITEITVHATYKLLDAAALARPERSPIGRALSNLDIRVVGPDGGPVPAGEPGEMFLGGDGVAHGYLNRPELNAERFVHRDLGDGPRRWYRSGDLAAVDEHGELTYVGRADDQVKIRGFRIEPGEIEAALRTAPRVRDAAVVVEPSRLGEPMLVAHVVLEPGDPVRDTALRRELREHLRTLVPAHYLPGRYAVAAALPSTPSGKVDRAALLRDAAA